MSLYLNQKTKDTLISEYGFIFGDSTSEKDNWFQEISTRDQFVKRYGFVLLTNDTVSELANICGSKKVAEVGSGLGYLSYRLTQAGCNVTAIDDRSWFGSSYNSTIWQLDLELDASKKGVLDNYDIIILSWPPMNSFAYNVIKNMQPNQYLIYQGEAEGGCTANSKFFEYLERKFILEDQRTEKLNKNHINFEGIHDRWYMYYNHKSYRAEIDYHLSLAA